MLKFIRRPIGAGLENDPDDIRLVRGTLKALAGEEINPENLSGFIDDELDTEIRNFQKDSGLIEDGQLTPGGETERNLIARITGEEIDLATAEDAFLRQSVGDGGENAPADVAAIKRALGTLGYLKYDRTAAPPPFIDAKTVAALTEFQNDTKLLPDGRAEPDGETIEALRELLGETPNRSVSDETQVAAGPALIALLLFLTRTAPHVAKLARGAAALGAANNAAREGGEKTRGRQADPDEASEFTGERSEGSKVEHIPPDPNRFGGGRTEFPPEGPDKNDGKLEGSPADPLIDIPAGFPIPDNPKDLVEIFPGNTEKPELPLIIERRGKESTRAFNAEVTRKVEKMGGKHGLKILHVGGSRDPEGREISETHLKNRDTGGLKGGNFLDISFEISGKCTIQYFINTVDTLVDGVTLSSRERGAAEQILYNMEDNAILHTIPKPGPDETIDLDALEERLEPIIKELKELVDNDSCEGAIERWIKTNEKLPTK